MNAGQERNLVARLRRLRRTGSDIQNPGVAALDLLPIRVAHVVPDPGVSRYHVRRLAGVGHDVVDPGAGLDVFAHEIYAVVHEFNGVEGAAPMPGPRTVGRPTEELDREVVHRHRALVVHLREKDRVPVERHVEVVEEPVPRHVDLPDESFFGRSAVKADCALQRVTLSGTLERNRGPDGARAEDVVSAAVSVGVPIRPWLLLRDGRVAEPRQRVVLGEQTDHRAAASPLGDEGGRHVCDTALYAEALLFERTRQQLGGSALLEPGLGVLPE